MNNPNITIQYHIFSHNIDDWTPYRQHAEYLYNLFKEQYGAARLYIERIHKEDPDMVDEDCIKSFGPFPY